jgi:hypothetical protein
MAMSSYTYYQLFAQVPFSINDVACIEECRGEHNRLGFAYQLAFVRFLNRFPVQYPLEIAEEIVDFVTIQLNIPGEHIVLYGKRRPTISRYGTNSYNIPQHRNLKVTYSL